MWIASSQFSGGRRCDSDRFMNANIRNCCIIFVTEETYAPFCPSVRPRPCDRILRRRVRWQQWCRTGGSAAAGVAFAEFADTDTDTTPDRFRRA